MARAGKDFTRTPLFILAFDHRGTFMSKMFGIKDRPPTSEECAAIAGFKQVIYEAFLDSLSKSVPKEHAGILVDEQFGSAVLADAKRRGLTFAVTVEKSGQDEFDFEHGKDFGKAIDSVDPTYAKVLVRFNPDWDAALNARQLARLKELGDFLAKSDRGYLFELIVPATPGQLASVNGDKKAFDSTLRPKLMVASMRQIHEAGIEPDLWKMEGVDSPEDARAIVAEAQAGGRKAGVITLGRGESKEKVREWLSVGAGVPGIIGFAVGRTIFWDALMELRAGKLSREEAVSAISQNYLDFVSLWQRGTQGRPAG